MTKLLKKVKDMPITAKVSIAYAICTMLQKCLSIITLPLFTRILTVEQYGQYSVYTSWSAILSIFVTLNLAYGSFQTAMVKFENKREEYIASVQGISVLMVGIFFVVYLPIRKVWNELFDLPTYLILIMIVEMLAQSSLLFWTGKKRFEYKYKSVVAITLFVSVLSPTVAYVLVTNAVQKGYARIIGYALVNIIVGLCFFLYNLYKGKKLFKKEYWKFALKFNIPLIPYYASQVIFNQSDRIMISKYCGEGKAGMYSVAYTLALLLNFVLNAINNSYVPWLYEKIKKKEYKSNKQISCMIALLMAILLLGVIWVAPEAILLMAGKTYKEAVWVVPPVAMSVLLLFYAQLFINVAFYYEKKSFLVWASIGAAVVNIGLNALMIPNFGYVAAGYTTLASYILFVISNGWGVYRSIEKKEILKEMYDIKALIGIFISMGLLCALAMILYETIVVRYIFGIGLLIIVVLNSKKLLLNLKKMKEI